jgi:FMN phosphatase YigB (HAD superfamily)
MVILFDVDNTLLDNDAVIGDLRDYLTRVADAERAAEYFRILEVLRTRLGYVDYLGTLQQYRAEHPDDFPYLQAARFLIDYPFRDRVFDGALGAVKAARELGTAAILSDGDVVFQPRKIERAGLWDAVEGRVIIHVHKEQQLAAVEHSLPSEHYVLVDDKRTLLGAIKAQWQDRVTTVWVKQGHYAIAPDVQRAAPADLVIERIADFARFSATDLAAAGSPMR